MALRRLVAGRALDFEQECHLWHHMTYFLAHDIVSGGGDGVVAVRWLLSCNLCCLLPFSIQVRCQLVISAYWHGAEEKS